MFTVCCLLFVVWSNTQVPPAPRSVRVTNATSTSLDVTWSAPRPSRGPLIAYRVSYWTEGSWSTDGGSRTVSVINAGTTITALTPYTRYYLTVSLSS